MTDTIVNFLMLEDNPVDSKMFRELLTGGSTPWLKGVKIESISKPFSDVNRYGNYHGVFVDLNLGAANGIAEARRIKAALPNLYLILLTGMKPVLKPDEASLFISIVDKNDLDAVFSTAKDLRTRVLNLTS